MTSSASHSPHQSSYDHAILNYTNTSTTVSVSLPWYQLSPELPWWQHEVQAILLSLPRLRHLRQLRQLDHESWTTRTTSEQFYYWGILLPSLRNDNNILFSSPFASFYPSGRRTQYTVKNNVITPIRSLLRLPLQRSNSQGGPSLNYTNIWSVSNSNNNNNNNKNAEGLQICMKWGVQCCILYLSVQVEVTIVSILFRFHHLLPGMWHGDYNYLLRLRICVLGRSETIVLRHAEAEQWRGQTLTPRRFSEKC